MIKAVASMICVLVGVAGAHAAHSQEFTGTYQVEGGRGVVTLALTQDQTGRVTGQLDNNGTVFRVDGARDAPGIGGHLVGDAGGAQFGFVAHLQNRQLWLKAFPFDASGAPDTANAVTMVFTRRTGNTSQP